MGKFLGRRTALRSTGPSSRVQRVVQIKEFVAVESDVRDLCHRLRGCLSNCRKYAQNCKTGATDSELPRSVIRPQPGDSGDFAAHHDYNVVYFDHSGAHAHDSNRPAPTTASQRGRRPRETRTQRKTRPAPGGQLARRLVPAPSAQASENGRSGRRREARRAPSRSRATEPTKGATQLPVRSTRYPKVEGETKPATPKPKFIMPLAVPA